MTTIFYIKETKRLSTSLDFSFFIFHLSFSSYLCRQFQKKKMAQTSLLERLDALVIRFEEIGTLITDPAVISDMKRYVKLNKEYSDLQKIANARNEYRQVLAGIDEAKKI
jgi:hypothetical protein